MKDEESMRFSSIQMSLMPPAAYIRKRVVTRAHDMIMHAHAL